MEYQVKKIIPFLLLFHSFAIANFDLSWSYDQYLTQTDLKNALDQYASLELKIKHNSYSDNWFYGVETLSAFSIDTSNQKYIAVPNLFFGYELPSIGDNYTINWIIGRYKKSLSILYNEKTTSYLKAEPEFWSVMDEIWEMGLWQSQINWDYFATKQQGLAGAFLTVKKEPWMLTVFLSGLFLPDHGPAVDIKPNGTIQSSSRWFIPPQSNFILFNQRIDTLYWINTPYLKNILLNESIATRFRFGDIHKQWMSIAYAKKPINQIYFTADSGFSIKESTINNMIYYHLFDHSLLSIEFGMKKEKWGVLVLSVTQEMPTPHTNIKHQITPVLPDALFFSSHTRWNVHHYLPLQYIDLNWIYTQHQSNGETHTQKISQQLSQSLPNNRFKLQQGFSITTQSKIFKIGKQKFSVYLRYWHSFPEKGDWIQSAIHWQLTPRLKLTGIIDILGANTEESFFKSYEQNDRVILKVAYAIH